ncbi:Zn-dependent peptidase ImmA, M78 family [Ruegeria intermedia]|uniref:Zn-dependent peptidase ImmA, M78 family n=1 Tax=Ruegeria intermedia TaxID=996115 RepID=A0A1M5BX58_9RHOB|nr:ImmA/IrrE family metallo-endopeptidase [Ruegeria intermedia]SHF47108.1 Zn-dependent peptidase ImmA, M78 family [Ruegeria intermedia]
MTRAPVKPEMLRWAIERARVSPDDLSARFKKLEEWLQGDVQPTLKQLDAFANAVHVPVGYLFLPEPPEEQLPIPDFRTVAGRPLERPSPNLLEMIYACQERQSWYAEFARLYQEPALPFVGSATLDTAPEVVAARIRDTLGFSIEERRDCATWTDALRLFIRRADDSGILVMVSGIVFSNTNRRLDVDEFRGFALVDRRAPLVFINGADSKAAQMFTLAHELAHIWLGTSALSNASAQPAGGVRREEVWCNKVAAELLMPLDAVRAELQPNEPLADTLRRLARQFKVSTLVVLRRLLDAGHLTRPQFDAAWQDELDHIREISQGASGGGNFYRTTLSRVSHRFTKALVVSTLEGQTLYRDAFRMLGVRKTETFNNLGREVGVMM